VATCASCGKEVPGEFAFCPYCGAALSERRAAVQEERKVVSVPFCELVGFTAASMPYFTQVGRTSASMPSRVCFGSAPLR
jgi:predicted RNA-binding Zn-ribbon protein involved in translation (DUF1610 family)